MRQLWHEVIGHRACAALFLVYWLAAWAITVLTWSGGMTPMAVVLHLLSPVIAGGMVGWWRAQAREGLLVGRGHLAGGPLAAALVILADVALVFGAAGLDGLLHGGWQASGAVGWLVEWVAWSAVLGLLALVLGLLGALVGATLARAASR
jgi:hypothetical protein